MSSKSRNRIDVGTRARNFIMFVGGGWRRCCDIKMKPSTCDSDSQTQDAINRTYSEGGDESVGVANNMSHIHERSGGDKDPVIARWIKI